MTFVKRIAVETALGAAVLIGASLSGPPAQAGYIVTLTQQGTSVVAAGSGSLDLTDLSLFVNGALFAPEIAPRIGLIVTGPTGVPGSTYMGYTGPTSFGSGGGSLTSSGSGDIVGINFFGTELEVPLGYISGDPLSDVSTYDNATFASLGVTPGTYVWTWGTGADADSFTVQIAVPEPSGLLLLGAGVAALLLMSAHRRGLPKI
jgi:PEP-CTERM motif